MGIDRIAEKGAADVFHMDPDLMSTAGVQNTEDEGDVGLRIAEEGVVIGDGRFAAAGVHRRHFLAVDRVAADVGEDHAARLGGDALGDGEVELGGFAVRELGGE